MRKETITPREWLDIAIFMTGFFGFMIIGVWVATALAETWYAPFVGAGLVMLMWVFGIKTRKIYTCPCCKVDV